MRTKSLFICGLVSAAVLSLSAKSVEMPLTNPEVPFARKETKSAEKQKPFLDEKGNCFRFGSKTVLVNPNGYIRIIDSGREIANIFFYTKNGVTIMIDAGYNYDRLAENVRQGVYR